MGGKGLRQWQVYQRKAYLNSWSMMDRLAHLERENALLRRENDLLRKVREKVLFWLTVAMLTLNFRGLSEFGIVVSWYLRLPISFLPGEATLCEGW